MCFHLQQTKPEFTRKWTETTVFWQDMVQLFGVHLNVSGVEMNQTREKVWSLHKVGVKVPLDVVVVPPISKII